METLLDAGNMLALLLLWLIVVMAYRTFWRAVAVPLARPAKGQDPGLFADHDPDEFWLVPVDGDSRVSPAGGLPVGSGLLLGRGEDSDLRFDDPFISERHLRVSCGRRACLLEDLDTANGYTVEGKPSRGESVLKEGQWFSVGDLTVHIERRPK